MKRTEKESFVAEFRDRVRKAPVLYLTDFTGLSVSSMTRLRHRLNESGAEYMVVKNRLVARSLEELDLPDIATYLRGPTGIVISEEGAVEPAKALSEFAKANGDRPVFKIGMVDRVVVEPGQFDRLAKLPPREELLAQLAGALEAPLSGFLGMLQAKLQETAGLLDALKQQKGG